MKRAALAAALVGLAALAGTPAHAQSNEAYIYVAPEFWHAGLSGDGETGRGASDENFDLTDTLGLESSSTQRALESFIRFREKYSVIFGFAHGDFSGADNVSSIFTYKNHTFLPGSRIHSDLSIDHKKLLYGTPFMGGKVFSGGLRVGLYEYRMNLEVKQSGTGSPDETLKSTIPILGASITYIPTRAVRIYGEALATSIDRSGVKSKVQEAYAALDYILFAQSFGVTVGYRYSSIKSEDSGRARIDVKQKGTFFGVVVKF